MEGVGRTGAVQTGVVGRTNLSMTTHCFWVVQASGLNADADSDNFKSLLLKYFLQVRETLPQLGRLCRGGGQKVQIPITKFARSGS